MSDEAQQQTGRRRTAMQTAEDVRAELDAYQKAINRRLDKLATPPATPTLDEMADAIAKYTHQAMEPIVAKANATLAGILGRLENLEAADPAGAIDLRPVVQGAFGADLESIRERLTELENRPTTGLPNKSAKSVPAVYSKVVELMRAVTALGKDRQAPKEAGGFAFRGIDQAMDAVGRAMRDIGLLLTTEIRNVTHKHQEATNSQGRTLTWTTTYVWMRYTFVAPEDGSTLVFDMPGEGRDSSDKSTSKACSMALKYGLFQALMIPVEGTPDGDSEFPQVGRDPRDDKTAADQASQPPADRPKKDPQERARDALAALRGLHQVELGKRAGHLAAIRTQVRQERLQDVEVDGATLAVHIQATMSTLVQPAADDQPSF